MEKRRCIYCAATISMILLIAGSTSLYGLWLENGTPVCAIPYDQTYPRIVTDSAGGAIITWTDNFNIFAQRADSLGNALWLPGGVAVCAANGDQYDPKIVTDGAGGAIIIWQDNRHYPDARVYLQRVDSSGTVRWATNGIPVSTTSYQNSPWIISDGAGGAIAAWQGPSYNYAQRIDADGNYLWAAAGVAICTVNTANSPPRIAPDGAGGAIITWGDRRGGVDFNVFAQRLDPAGSLLWTIDGVGICPGSTRQRDVEIVADGAGGAIIAWIDFRNDPTASDKNIYSQRINSAGSLLWPIAGVPVCTAPAVQDYPSLVSDDAKGAIIVWHDLRNGNADIYAQRVDSLGSVQWTANGIVCCALPDDQSGSKLIADGAGGAIITWHDRRSGEYDIYAQRIAADSTKQWTADGLAICGAADDQTNPVITSAYAGGAIIGWMDMRNGDWDIFAQWVGPDGQIMENPAPTITAVEDVPNDQGGKIFLQWERSCLDTLPNTEITHYSAWRRLPLLEGERATLPIEGAGALDIPIDFSGCAIRLSSDGYSWEWLGNTPAHHFQSYTLIVESLYDSMGTDPGWQYFMISAHTADMAVYYDSPIDSGYSVDNLSPGQPQGLAGMPEYGPPALVLAWEPNAEPDLLEYAVYRGADADFEPGPANLLATTLDTAYTDDYEFWNSCYYKISAFDVHGNESSHALLGPDDVTGGVALETPLATSLGQNFPNPFNPRTTIRFGLVAAAHVSLRIYNASGRLVRVLADKTLEPGRYEEVWNGRDETGGVVASGVYFCRLQAGGFEETKKMVLLR